MVYQVKNICGKTTLAQHPRICADERSAHNVAKNYSADFHGVFAVIHDGREIAYYVSGRKYLKQESAWLARS